MAIALTACQKDETISGQSTPTDTWQLSQMNGKAIAADITLTFPEKGRIAGRAPCNTYFASQTAPLPWFEVTAIASTKRACPELELEEVYFQALESMTLIERTGPTLLLSNDSNQSLEYRLK
ncbi:MAG: META domain-containing protein [Amylibacter sp.]|nr:META domain-containing protein [Amylibacter sp.]